jgi:hypothetical protein
MGASQLGRSMERTRVSPTERVTLALYREPLDVERARTRADCMAGGMNAERPCPYVTCRHHLAVEVTPAGNLRLVFPEAFEGLEPHLERMRATCSIDVAEQGAHDLDDVAAHMNVSAERVRQIQERAQSRHRESFAAAREGEFVAPPPKPLTPPRAVPQPTYRLCECGCGERFVQVINKRYSSEACRRRVRRARRMKARAA